MNLGRVLTLVPRVREICEPPQRRLKAAECIDKPTTISIVAPRLGIIRPLNWR